MKGISFLILLQVFCQSALSQIKTDECEGRNDRFYKCSLFKNGILLSTYSDKEKKKLIRTDTVLSPQMRSKVLVSSRPQIACDLSPSAFRNRIYICWSDNKSGKKNDDVYLSYSDSDGKNWCEPVLLTYYPNHKAQSKPALYVDENNGKVYVLYYDARNYPEGGCYDVVLAVSENGGLKFENYQLNSHYIKGPQLQTSLSLNEQGRLMANWKEPVNKNNERYFEINDSSLNLCKKRERSFFLQHERSVPFQDQIEMPIKILEDLSITAILTKPTDSGYEKVIFNKKPFTKSNNVLLINTKALALKKTHYIVTLYYRGISSYFWITAE
ncbi:MAG TPA: sialidase family protein [Bacteroidia bacterium]|nr:sialidase family protein [Bacteroidia bacterium]